MPKPKGRLYIKKPLLGMASIKEFFGFHLRPVASSEITFTQKNVENIYVINSG